MDGRLPGSPTCSLHLAGVYTLSVHKGMAVSGRACLSGPGFSTRTCNAPATSKTPPGNGGLVYWFWVLFSMIQLTAAGKRFGPKLLFENLDWLITPKARVGLVGANGTGKSTLLKVLAGIEPLDYGAITSAKSITAGYLPQDGLVLGGRTVLGECLTVFEELREIEREVEMLTHQMAEFSPESDEYHQVTERYHRLEGQFRARDRTQSPPAPAAPCGRTWLCAARRRLRADPSNRPAL